MTDSPAPEGLFTPDPFTPDIPAPDAPAPEAPAPEAPAPEAPAPVVDLPLAEAVQQLYGYEARLIEAHYKTTMEHIGGIGLTMGVVWAYENRDGKKRSWSSVEKMTLGALTGYFPPAPEDPDEDDPDSDAGKDDW